MTRRVLLTILTCALSLRAAVAQTPPADATPPVTWDTLESRMKWEADHGFSGVVLVARDGKIAFHQAYGMANRDKSIAMRPDTILAIGSTPIDFTKAGILLLAERGKLDLSDLLSKHIPNVPNDKKTITIEHLMTGRSGLPNFHDLPTDRDRDHSWIDRDESVRRILGQKLLFEPGKGRQHSHSAWGLLAAIIEIVSGQNYPDFTREHLFKPAGMNDTGFFGEPIPEERLAIGYGPRKDGTINAPPYWGKTSWLVMGSGGQVSTAEDMWRWAQAVRNGTLLKPDSVKRYGPPDQMLAGGDVYGFEILYTGSPQSFMVVMTNAGSARRMPQFQKLGTELAALVSGRKPAKFTLGIQLAVEDAGRSKIDRVVPGGAGEQAGLRAGDIVIKLAGKDAGSDPMAAIAPFLQSGDPIEFEIERAGQRKTMMVKPAPRSP
jgi:CubicO group peptidase (beta-lactamase class C family)